MPIYALGSYEPRIHPDAFVHPEAILIGNVEIAADASVWPQAVIRADSNLISVGERTSIQDGAVLHCTHHLPTMVGADCVVGHLAHLEGCTVEDAALIGTGSIVLHRVVVRTNALVGAGAVVPAGLEVPRGAMAIGVPAKIRLDAVTPDQILPLAANYLENATRYRAELRRVD